MKYPIEIGDIVMFRGATGEDMQEMKATAIYPAPSEYSKLYKMVRCEYKFYGEPRTEIHRAEELEIIVKGSK